MVTPEVPNPPVADLWVRVVGLGSDGPLVGAEVTIDNHAYVEPHRAGTWRAKSTSDGVARFPRRVRGKYDVHVRPDDLHGEVGTPAWNATSVDLDDAHAIVAYRGMLFEAIVDWPELAGIGSTDLEAEVLVGFWIDGTRPRWGVQRAGDNGSGRLIGMIPWEGEFHVDVEIMGEGFELRYRVPEPVRLEAGGVVAPGSPLTEYPIRIHAGGAPLESGSVQVYHGLTHRRGQIDQSVNVRAGAASALMMPAELSSFWVSWNAGPRFLPRERFLSEENMSPGTIDLGAHVVTLRVVDPDGAPIPDAVVAITIEPRTQHWPADATGRLDCFLDPGFYRLETSSDGFAPDLRIVEIDDDLVFTIVLERG
jgi:hypothetical protein